jgi:tellurite resistance protein
VTLLSKLYGGTLRPGDPRRYLIEAIVGAMQADGVVTRDELDTLERNLAEHEMFAGLSQEATRVLVEMATDSIALAGGCLKRVRFIARGLPARTHRMAAYAVACEIAFSDGETPQELAYLNELRKAFLLGDDEATALFNAAQKRQGMAEVEWRTRQLQGLMPWYLECMALMAAIDGTVTAAERHALSGVLKNVGDMSILGERERDDAIEAAFRRIAGKEPESCLRAMSSGLETGSDRYWAAVYTSVIAVADGYTNWRSVWLLGSLQEAFRLSDDQMERAMQTAKLFPIPTKN